MTIETLGVDIAKNVFQLHGVSRNGRVILKRRVMRDQLLEVIAQIDRCTVVVEACTGAFYWTRKFEALGHQVKVISPQYVKPFVRRQKNDGNDAEAICTVPMPRTASFDALNAKLIDDCHGRLGDRLRGHAETIGERLVRDLAAFQSLPATPYDACEKRTGRVSSLSLVRYRGNDYSVPTTYGHREILIRGYVHEVVISCGAEVIARHARSYEREDFVFNPLHYLALLEQKSGALDQAAPLVGWDLPEEFATFRRLLEARMGKRGKREFVQVLRLLESFRRDDVVAGIKQAMARGTIGFDAVKHLVLCRIERRPPRLDLTVYPYLPRASVATTSARAYMDLLTGAAS